MTTTNAVIECILSRSAAKYYDPAATLSDDQIRELVRIGTTAPTSFHLQNWRFIAVRTETTMPSRVDGVPWLKGTSKAVPINALAANILCTRHNSAMSPLDTMAGKFFAALRRVYDDLGNPKTLSRKSQWFLFSGEELELWLVKTAFDLYYSGNVGKDGKKLCDVQGN
jgi:nitroreductase